jgi:FKBP-type peptidyl-prolyl cis-trans isomerase
MKLERYLSTIAVVVAAGTLAACSSATPAPGAAAPGEPIPANLPGEPATGTMQSTPSGLKYIVLREGSGTKPTLSDRVQVHYTGYLMDGTKFDSSVDSGQPANFGVTQVITGWQEGLQLMSPGAKYKLIVPAALGYAATGFPPLIPPNADLVFDLELLSVE